MNKILIIDDTESNIAMIKEILGNIYEIKAISDSKEITEEAIVFKPDLILLDVLMPHKTGYEICKELKLNYLLKKIPIIFITSKNGIDDKLKGFLAGAQDYISIPFYAKEVLERIKVHIDLKKSREKLEHYLTLLEEKNQRLLELSKIDYLTEVANRRYIIERIKEERLRSINHNKKFVLALCDIDHFKEVNDSYGHEIGDIVLKGLAQAIKAKLKKEDVLARWGGEEFLILMPDIDLHEAKQVVENIRENISLFKIKHKGFKIIKTVTIGLVEFDLNYSIEENINNADKVLYKGKRSGRNRVEVY